MKLLNEARSTARHIENRGAVRNRKTGEKVSAKLSSQARRVEIAPIIVCIQFSFPLRTAFAH